MDFFSWLQLQVDYLFYISGLVFFTLFFLAYSIDKYLKKSPFEWNKIYLFGFLFGLFQWLQLVFLNFPEIPYIEEGILFIYVLSVYFLFEFGRVYLSHKFKFFQNRYLFFIPVLISLTAYSQGIYALRSYFYLFFGFPAVLMVGASFIIYAFKNQKHKKLLFFISFFLIFYGFINSLYFFQIIQYNNRSFVLLIQTLLAFTGTILFFIYYGKITAPFIRKDYIAHKKIFVLLFIFISILGFVTVENKRHILDSEMKNNIFYHSRNISNGINPALFNKLDFTVEDKNKPEFRRLQYYLNSYGEFAGLPYIYTVGKKNGTLLFGPENIDPETDMASLPGTEYLSPPDVVEELFETPATKVVGPYTDEYGTFISALTSVKKPGSDETLSIVGVDFKYDKWLNIIFLRRFKIIIKINFLFIIIALSFFLLEKRDKKIKKWGSPFFIKYLEVFLTLFFGIILTIFIVTYVYELEAKNIKEDFSRISNSKMHIIADLLNDHRYNLHKIINENKKKPFTSNKDFKEYTDDFINNKITRFYAQAQKNQHNIYKIKWINPLKNYKEFLNYNLSSRLEILASINKAHTDSLFQTVKKNDFLETSESERLVISKLGAEKILLCLFDLEKGIKQVLKEFASPFKQRSEIIFFDLLQNGNTEIITCFPCNGDYSGKLSLNEVVILKNKPFYETYPFFIYGQPYIIALFPNNNFLASNKALTSLMISITGFILTFFLALFVYSMKNKQEQLQKEVNQRTYEIKEKENNLRITLDSIGDAVIATDLNGNITRMNPVAQKLTGYSIHEVKGTHIDKIFKIKNAKTEEILNTPIDYVLKNKQVFGLSNDTTLIAKNKNEYQIADSAAPILDEEGKIQGVVLVFHDVTQQYKIREQLFESERSKSVLLSNLPGIAYRCKNDKFWTMEFLSSGCLELTGYRGQDLLNNKNLSFNDIIVEEFKEELRHKWDKAISEKKVFSGVYQIKTANTEIKWVWERGRGVYDEEGNIIALKIFYFSYITNKTLQ
ncbi:MAG: PAS domain-containing protein, partial [Candidatus Muiribacteriota bacterium]